MGLFGLGYITLIQSRETPLGMDATWSEWVGDGRDDGGQREAITRGTTRSDWFGFWAGLINHGRIRGCGVLPSVAGMPT